MPLKTVIYPPYAYALIKKEPEDQDISAATGSIILIKDT